MTHGRYWETPCAKKIRGIRPTLKDRIRKWLKRRNEPDVFPIVDYWPAVYPNKK